MKARVRAPIAEHHLVRDFRIHPHTRSYHPHQHILLARMKLRHLDVHCQYYTGISKPGEATLRRVPTYCRILRLPMPAPKSISHDSSKSTSAYQALAKLYIQPARPVQGRDSRKAEGKRHAARSLDGYAPRSQSSARKRSNYCHANYAHDVCHQQEDIAHANNSLNQALLDQLRCYSSHALHWPLKGFSGNPEHCSLLSD